VNFQIFVLDIIPISRLSFVERFFLCSCAPALFLARTNALFFVRVRPPFLSVRIEVLKAEGERIEIFVARFLFFGGKNIVRAIVPP